MRRVHVVLPAILLGAVLWPPGPEFLAAQEVESEVVLLVEATESSVWLRWTLPEEGFPDAGFLVHRRDGAGVVEETRIPSPLSRDEAVERGLIGEEDYGEFVAAFSPDAELAPDEAEARDLNRAFLTLATFTRPGWAQVLGTVHEDTDVAAGATYTYRVTATFSGRSVLIGEEEVTVGDVEPLPAISGLEAEADAEGIRLRWHLPEEGFVVAFRVFRTDPDGTERDVSGGGLFISQREDPETGALVLPEVFLHDGEVEINTTYAYSVAGVNVMGRETPRSDPVSIFFPDPEPLEVPVVSAVDVRDREIELFWAPPGDERVAAIGVVRTLDPVVDPDLLTPEMLPPSSTNWVDGSVEGGVSYYYALVAMDEHGRSFGPGSYWAARAVNLQPPSAPTGLSLEATEESLILDWEAPPEPDVHGYQIFLVRDDGEDGLILVTEEFVGDTRYTFPVPPGTLDELRLAVRAVNTSFVEGPLSEPVAGRIIDVVPPAPPVLNGIRAGEGSVSVSWAFTADPDVAFYRVLRQVQGEDDFSVARERLAPDETLLVDTDVVPGLLHIYSVEAVDASGNVSERAAPLAATPFRLARPAPPEGLAARVVEEGGVHLQWEASASGGVLFYVVERSTASGRWVQVGDPLLADAVTFLDPTGRPGLAYRIVAIDTSGQTSDPSEAVVVPD